MNVNGIIIKIQKRNWCNHWKNDFFIDLDDDSLSIPHILYALFLNLNEADRIIIESAIAPKRQRLTKEI